jgi:hypothetical protein
MLLATTEEAPTASPIDMLCINMTNGNVKPKAASSKVPTNPM